MSGPKAKFYWGSTSLWTAVVRLTIVEKGYGDDEIEWKEVDLAKGENYDADFLRINPFGTVPTLVVPLEKNLHDTEAKYKAITDSRPIVEFLDKSRSSRSKTHTTSDAPAPVLTPATISHLDTSNRIIEAINSVAMFNYMLGTRTEEELQKLLTTPLPARVRTRVEGVTRTLAAQIDIGLPKKAVPTLEARKEFLGSFLQVFEVAAVPPANRTVDQQALIEAYFAKSDAAWSALLPKQLATLEREIVGPLALGDMVSIADMYLAAFITRLVVIHGGDGSPGAIEKLPSPGPKLKAFWEAFIQRPSWQKVFGAKPF